MFKFLVLILFLAIPYKSFADANIVKRIRSKGLKITKYENDLYYVQLKKRKLKIGKTFLIVRILSDNKFELMAQGTVEGNQGSTAYVQLIDEQMFKIPAKNDYLVPIGDGVLGDDSAGVEDGDLIAKEAFEGEEPGYIQLGYAFNSGEYATESTTRANNAKDVKYNYNNFHLKWYFDFLWRLGVEYNFYSDDVPTKTFLRREFDSKRTYSDLKVNYRLKKWGDSKFRSIFTINMINDEFSTDNPDENLLTTNYNLIGVGKKINYEFHPDYKKLSGFDLKLTKLYLSAIYYPIIDVEDVGVSRGTDSEPGFSYSYSVGAEALLYWDKIPWIKRWFLSLEYHSVFYDSTFSGSTMSETGALYKIPVGTETSEQHNTFRITFGFRIKDFIGQFFRPR